MGILLLLHLLLLHLRLLHVRLLHLLLLLCLRPQLQPPQAFFPAPRVVLGLGFATRAIQPVEDHSKRLLMLPTRAHPSVG